jgi:hypothetical protein
MFGSRLFQILARQNEDNIGQMASATTDDIPKDIVRFPGTVIASGKFHVRPYFCLL